jgi:tRNA pseudouridine38-40 synthase
LSRVIVLLVEYDGTDFVGWQYQPELRSVQGVLNATIEKMVQHPVTTQATSRTDRGVHARGLPVTFETAASISTYGFLRGLNTLLPPDVAILSVQEEPAGYRVRDAVVGKTYLYRFQYGPGRRPLLNRFSYFVKRPELNVNEMAKAAQHLVGEHDFASFRFSQCSASTTTRYMHDVRIEEVPGQPLIHLKVIGNAFLQHMIRIFAGTLLDTGLGLKSADGIPQILADRDRRSAGPTLASCGLTLEKVHFQPLPGWNTSHTKKSRNAPS